MFLSNSKYFSFLFICIFIITLQAEENWVATGVGSPIKSHKDFDKVGAECDEGYVATGIRFFQGGCDISATYTQKILNYQACTTKDNEMNDTRQGLIAEIDCQKPHYPIYEGKWFASGVGSPLPDHISFQFVGARCPEDHVVTGFRYRQGGCNVHKNWLDSDIDETTCRDPRDDNQGLIMEVKCSSFKTIPSSKWSSTGVGTPLQYHANFDRVGGHCPGNTMIRAISMFPSGPSGHTPHNWTEGILEPLADFPNGTIHFDNATGLVLRLLCEQEDPTVQSPLIPPSDRFFAGQKMVATIYQVGIATIDKLLFSDQVSEIMEIPQNWAEVTSVVLHGSKFNVNFIVYNSYNSCVELIDMVKKNDPSVKGTYLGISGSSVKFDTNPNPGPQPNGPSLMPFAPTLSSSTTPSRSPPHSPTSSPIPIIELPPSDFLSSESSNSSDNEDSSLLALWIVLGVTLSLALLIVFIVIIVIITIYAIRRFEASKVRYSKVRS